MVVFKPTVLIREKCIVLPRQNEVTDFKIVA